MRLLHYFKKTLSAADPYLTALVVLLLMWPCLKLFPMLLNPPSVLWSDYEDILFRYDALAKGAMSVWDFIFIKHGGHNHAFIFFLGLLDIWVDHGKLWLLSWSIIFSNFAVFGIYVYLIRKVITEKWPRFVTTAFIASQIFTMRGGEIWAVSFQAVVTCFRLFLVAGLWMFCRALLEQKGGFRLLVISLLILLAASVSHGSGVLVPPLLLAIYAVVYVKNDYPYFQKKSIIPILILLLIFIVHEMLYPANDPGFAPVLKNVFFADNLGFADLLKNVPFSEWARVPRYLAYMLGYFFAWNLRASIQTSIGVIGILTFLSIGYKVLIKRPSTPTHLFFLASGLFSLTAALMSIVFNLGQMEAREIAQGSTIFLLSSRYIFMPTGFWTATIVLLFSELGHFSRQYVYQKIISIGAMLIVLFSIYYAVICSFHELHGWSRYLKDLFEYEKIIATDHWKSIPVVTLNDQICGLPNHQRCANLAIEIQKKYGLGPYAKISEKHHANMVTPGGNKALLL
jgi:hypothetical protein